jgi:hypothetical protein
MTLRMPETIGKQTAVAESTVALLRKLIDYAGLFPPASLAMEPALANYDAYLRSTHGWILGRFIVPVARLAEFEQTLTRLSRCVKSEPRWPLSVLLGTDTAADIAHIREFNVRSATGRLPIAAEIQSVEVKVAGPEEIERLSAIIPAELETYFEVPVAGSEPECIAAISANQRRAKIRTGGETADRFPVPESLIEFIRLCLAARIPFKATAGLHHPIRSQHPFTYQSGSPVGVMHGFLNLFLAAAFLRAGEDPANAFELLKEESAQAFHLDSEGVLWREHRVSLRDIAAARQGFSISFGSCSFAEPIEDLQSLHVL